MIRTLASDKIGIDQLKSIGIEKGKPFNPDARMQDQLKEAAREANAWLDVRFAGGFPPFFEGSQWLLPASQELTDTAPTFYEKTDLYPVDARGVAYSFSFGGVIPQSVRSTGFPIFSRSRSAANFSARSVFMTNGPRSISSNE